MHQTLFESLTRDRQHNAEILEKLSMIGLKNSVIDKYSDAAHFVYELLQNADDVKATTARFVLNEHGLIFAHNGNIHFSLSDPKTETYDTKHQQLGHINALTSIGHSNKNEAHIGQFGVGFKAVFQYTHAPEIYDPHICFKIEKFIIPYQLNTDHPDRLADETLFYLPFFNASHAFQAILQKLQHLTHPLLFLKYLISIKWTCCQGHQGIYHKRVEFIDQHTRLIHTHIQDFLVLHHHNHTKIAYPLSKQGRISYKDSFPAYCFFPTKESTGLRFIIQAPFLLTESRESIKSDELWNQKCIQTLAQLTADSLHVIKKRGLLTDDFFNVLPLHPIESLFQPIYEAVLKQLQSKSALLPTITGKHTTQNHAYLTEDLALRTLFSAKQLSSLLKKAEWVFPDIQPQQPLWPDIKQHLINQVLTIEILLTYINKTFIQNQSDAWLIQFYGYLFTHPSDSVRTKEILRLSNNTLVSAYNHLDNIQVYLPTEHESEYPTIKRCFVENEQSRQFLVALGLSQPQDYDEIQYYILPRYQKSEKMPKTLMRQDFKKLLHYFLNCPSCQKTAYLTQLKKVPFCRTTTRHLMSPPLIYFKTAQLSTYFSHYPHIYFLDAAFYDDFDKTTVFFKELGVEDTPRILKIKANLSPQERETIHQGHCTHDYYHVFQCTYDYDIEGLDSFIANMTLAKSKILWHFLLKQIDNNISFTGQYNWFYRREKYHFFDAKFLITLRHTAWLYHHQRVTPNNIIVSELAIHYDITPASAHILIEKLEIPAERTAEVPESALHVSIQFKQKIEILTRIEHLKSLIEKTPKYSFQWFKTLLELEYVLSDEHKQTPILDIKNPNFLLEHLKTVFQQLPYDSHHNLQNKITKNIEFIFGPPGTGKTTYLAKNKIIPLMTQDLKILVLTPTNKVADVLITKMDQPYQNWLIRFGVTEDKTIANAGLLKNKYFKINRLKKCVVITTLARFLYDGFLECSLKECAWDIIIFDEASMIMLAQIVYVLSQQKHCHFIIAGDPFQIQPVVSAEAWKDENIYTFLALKNFKTLKTAYPLTIMTTQYRSIPPLGALVSQFTYDNLLTHHRTLDDQKHMGFDFKAITLITFPVKKFDSLYRSQRLDKGGAYHIYSAILTVEYVLYLSKKILRHNQQHWSIGIVCPYLTQATLVEKMIAVLCVPHPHMKIIIGTVHRFQGDECDIMVALFNAPPHVSTHIFLNNKNILNVAISRAKNYLILIIPKLEGLEHIKTLKNILKSDEFKPYVQEFSAAEIESILFNQSNYIDEHSFLSVHQKVNVYAKPEKRYEIRYEENAVDIQLRIDS